MLVFEWDDANIRHLAEHEITPEEAEQAMLNRPIDLPAQLRNLEKRFVQVGETEAGRILVVVTTQRRGRVRVVTAFPANRSVRRRLMERRDYGEAGSRSDIRD